MSEMLPYREPDTKPAARPAGPRQIVRTGLVIFICSVMLALFPMMLSLGEMNKYPIAFGFVGASLGLSCMLNGVLDRWRGRR